MGNKNLELFGIFFENFLFLKCSRIDIGLGGERVIE